MLGDGIDDGANITKPRIRFAPWSRVRAVPCSTFLWCRLGVALSLGYDCYRAIWNVQAGRGIAFGWVWVVPMGGCLLASWCVPRRVEIYILANQKAISVLVLAHRLTVSRCSEHFFFVQKQASPSSGLRVFRYADIGDINRHPP